MAVAAAEFCTARRRCAKLDRGRLSCRRAVPPRVILRAPAQPGQGGRVSHAVVSPDHYHRGHKKPRGCPRHEGAGVSSMFRDDKSVAASRRSDSTSRRRGSRFRSVPVPKYISVEAGVTPESGTRGLGRAGSSHLRRSAGHRFGVVPDTRAFSAPGSGVASDCTSRSRSQRCRGRRGG